jgi:POT family proton-dependent oligopeptide transporter
MVIGLIQYTAGAKYLGDAGLYPSPPESPQAAADLRRRATIGGVAIFVVLAVLGVGMATGTIPITATQVADAAGYFLLFLTLGFFGWLFFAGEWTPVERRRLYVIGILFLAAALFWSAFEQAGSTLNLFADRSTRTSVLGWSFPSSWFQSMNSAFLFMLAPVFAWIWLRMGKNDPSSPTKFGLGLILVGAGFAVLIVAAQLAADGTQVSPMWLTVVYLLHTCGELTLSPVGLSAMTKLAPVRIGGLMMGVWFLATSVGNFIGGRISSFYESWALPSLFGAVGLFAIGAGILLFLFVKPIKQLMGEVN